VATIGFLQDLINAPYVLSLAALVVIITVVAVVGISEAVSAVVIITVIEVGALVYICLVKGDVVLASPERLVDVFIPTGIPAWSGIFLAAFLAFYAFIGFEDMVTLAEEVKDARRAVPLAIITCILCTLVIYAAVATIAVLAVEPEALANARTPLAVVIADGGWFSRAGIGIVSILTGINGALVQVIMAARVVYGMSKRRQAPVWLGAINPRTRTPIRASLLAGAVILGLALTFDLATLAKITSAIILVIFAMVNLSLLIIKRDQAAPGGVIAVPKSVPLLGALACSALLLFQVWNLTV
jgi:amino acid transporter